jgi:hypothetical protein
MHAGDRAVWRNCRTLAGSIIDTVESSFRKRQLLPVQGATLVLASKGWWVPAIRYLSDAPVYTRQQVPLLAIPTVDLDQPGSGRSS